MLGLLDKTESESQKIKREMSDKRLKRKRGTTAATMETQRGAKAPLVSSMSQSLSSLSPLFKSPVLLPTASDGPMRFTLAPEKTQTQMSESSSLFSLLQSFSRSLWALQILGSALLLIIRTAYYPLHHDITSTQTSSRCLSWRSNRTLQKGYVMKEQMIPQQKDQHESFNHHY